MVGNGGVIDEPRYHILHDRHNRQGRGSWKGSKSAPFSKGLFQNIPSHGSYREGLLRIKKTDFTVEDDDVVMVMLGDNGDHN